MQFITQKAHAKINLALDVTGCRSDGYHNVKMVMQTIELHDVVTIQKNDSNCISMQTNLHFLPTDKSNLAIRAAEMFYTVTGLKCQGIHIDLEKRIPIAAGLAGGSTDAAAVLHSLNSLHDMILSTDELCEMGLALGADVPYCLKGGSMLAEGVGEILTPWPSMPQCFVIVCKPPFSVSTANIYRKIDGIQLSAHPDFEGLNQAFIKNDYYGICHRLYNVMEEVTAKTHPEIAAIEDILLSNGAEGAIMSGSGPTVFGLFQDYRCAQKAYELLRKCYVDTFLTKIL